MIVIPAKSFAQSNGVGNGGNAIVCYDAQNQIQSVQLFDYWEMKQAYPAMGDIDLGATTLSVGAKIDIFTKRVSEWEPTLGQKFSNDAHLIADNIDYYLADYLPTVNDDTSTFVPQSPCAKKQFAVQFTNLLPGERRFIVDRAIYNNTNTSNDTRAGIILHEVIYRYAISQFQHTNSDSARALNFGFASYEDAATLADIFRDSRLGFQNYMAAYRFPGTDGVLVLTNPGHEVGYAVSPTNLSRDRFRVHVAVGARVEMFHNYGETSFRLSGEYKPDLNQNVWKKSIHIHLVEGKDSYWLQGLDNNLQLSSVVQLNNQYGVFECSAAHFVGTPSKVDVCTTFAPTVTLNMGNNPSVDAPDKTEVYFDGQGAIEHLNAQNEFVRAITPLGPDKIPMAYIQFDPTGKINGGIFSWSDGYVFNRNNHTYRITEFEVDSTTGEILYGKLTGHESNGIGVKENTQRNGLPIVIGRPGDNEYDRIPAASQTICKERNYVDAWKDQDWKAFSVLGAQNLYDPEAQATIMYTDETVLKLNELWCKMPAGTLP